MAIRSYWWTPPTKVPHVWTPEEDALLAQLSDSEIAERLGISTNEVILRRQQQFYGWEAALSLILDLVSAPTDVASH